MQPNKVFLQHPTTGYESASAARGRPPRPVTTQARESQTDVVIRRVLGMITAGDLGPGSRLPVENELAERFGVSRGSLREGVRALCTLGVLETRQGAGTYVTSLDAALLVRPLSMMAELTSASGGTELDEVRRLLEVEAAGRAAVHISESELAALERCAEVIDEGVRELDPNQIEAVAAADARFHALLAAAGGNDLLAALTVGLEAPRDRVALWSRLFRRGQARDAHAEHWAIIDGLRAGDADTVRSVLARHCAAAHRVPA